MKAWADLETALIGVFFLALVAAIVASGQSTQLINAAGSFLVNMVQKVQGA